LRRTASPCCPALRRRTRWTCCARCERIDGGVGLGRRARTVAENRVSLQPHRSATPSSPPRGRPTPPPAAT
jgi:hypothetical protein